MSDPSSPDWHYLDWSEQQIEDFWNFTANWPAHHVDYFTRQVGKGVIRFARTLMPFTQEVVDFGCGKGDLIECLLADGIPCMGVDSSAGSVDFVNARFQGRVGWKGAIPTSGGRTPMPDGSAGTLFFVETIEHLPPEVLREVLRELRRLLKPGEGRLFVTTPDDELLAREQVFCPACHSVFHRYQHVATFSKTTLAQTLEAMGFTTIACDTTDFGRYVADIPAPRRRSVLDVSMRDVLHRIKMIVRKPSPNPAQPSAPEPHLYWVGSVPRE